MATFGEFGGPPLVFHAPRGLGKTSLLRSAEQDAQPLGFITTWLSCVRGHSLLPDLVRGVGRSLERADITRAGSTHRAWRARLEKVGVELGVPGAVKVSTDIGVDHEPAAVPLPAHVAAVEDLLHDAATHVRRRGGAGLFLLVDELHAATTRDLAVLLNALQNLAGERDLNPIAVATAGLPSTPEVVTGAATFGERSHFIELPRFDDYDSRRAITEPAEQHDVTWTAAALDACTTRAAGYPYFLQLLGHATWQAAQPPAGTAITLDHVTDGVNAAQGQLNAMHRARWNSASPHEQRFMAAMAAAASPTVTRRHIADALSQHTSALSVPRDRLIDKGIIEPVGRGHLRFSLPGFADYVREHSDT